jgi:hypothetical protein
MRTHLCLAILVPAVPAWAAEPVVVHVQEHATARSAIVRVGDVAHIAGGDRATRERIAALDIADLQARDTAVIVTRRSVEYRLLLAGLDAADFRLTGAERVGVAAARRPVTAEEIVAAVKAEVLRLVPGGAAEMTAELLQPLAVRLPEIPTGEPLHIAAKPQTRITGPGRVQMNVTLSAGSEKLLAFALLFDVKQAAPQVIPAAAVGAVRPVAPPTEVLVRARQRVAILARTGSLSVSAAGEAMQDGRLGQMIQVQNVDSKKNLVARVTGPAQVEIELGEQP